MPPGSKDIANIILPDHLQFLFHEELMTQLFIEVGSTIVSGAFFQVTDAHPASFSVGVLSRFLPGGSTEGFWSKFAWGQTMPTAWLTTIRHHQLDASRFQRC